MPTYVCSAATGRLTSDQRAEIVRRITAIHHEETGAPRYLVQVIFHDVAPGNHYVAGRPAPADQIWIRADIRGGRTDEQKSQMLRRIMQDVGRASGGAEDAVWINLCDLPAANIAEYGRVLPPPGQEDAWFSSLPDAIRKGSGPWPDDLQTLGTVNPCRQNSPTRRPMARRGSTTAPAIPCKPVRTIIGESDVETAYAVQEQITKRRIEQGAGRRSA